MDDSGMDDGGWQKLTHKSGFCKPCTHYRCQYRIAVVETALDGTGYAGVRG
ncbi:hypothetical protein ACI2KG_21175 [Pseudomonas sp. NPDC089407]|uniref:hypothetical protein n=1 Tax=Pseudomonas sp. NPDC089407 TaxID=3364464 RepID=UPI00384B1A44